VKPILMTIVDLGETMVGGTITVREPGTVLFDGEAAQVPRPGDLVEIEDARYIVRGVVWSIETDLLGNRNLRSVRVEVD
jgi:hypothetical protein